MKLIDFGTAFVIPENTLVKHLFVAELFCSPELINYGPAALPVDVWYLAMVFYSLVHP